MESPNNASQGPADGVRAAGGEIPKAALPEAISESLLMVARRRQRLVILAGLLRALLIMLVFCLLAALLLGSFPDLPSAVRWVVTLGLWGTVITSTVILLRPAFKPIHLRQAAGLIHASHRDHDERILSAVEFSELEHPHETGSPELIHHVIHQAQTDAQSVQPQQVLSVAAVYRIGAYCTPAVLAWIILWPLMPQRLSAGLSQTFLPWRSAVTGQDLQLLVRPGDTALAAGDSLAVTVRNIKAGGAPGSMTGLNLLVHYPAGGDRTIAMTRSGPRSFEHNFSSVISSFNYRISCRRGITRWYHVRAMVRPRIESLELHFTFPAYTRLTPKTYIGRRGSIRVLRGTSVQLIVHASQPLKKNSDLEIGKGIDSRLLPLTPLVGLAYQATFHILLSGEYRIHLVDTQGIKNKDDRPWPIVAIADNPPVVHILSPRKILRVRPDDVIPVRFTATDDFGLTRLTAIVSVDHSVPMRYHIALGARDLTSVKRMWQLAVADQLLAAGLPRGKKIFYRIAAADNCEPASQTSRSAVHELILDPNLPLDYQARQNKKAYARLHGALTTAIRHIGEARQQLNNLNYVAPGKAFNPQQQNHADKLQDDLGRAVSSLRNQAAHLKHSPYAAAAAAAGRIATHGIQRAANHVAAAIMDSPSHNNVRKAQLTAARKQMADAQSKLQHLLWKLNKQAGEQNLLDSVKSIARAQRSVSRQMALNPNSAQARRSQAQLQQQLKQLIEKHKTLQTPTAASVAPMLDKLKAAVGDIIAGQNSMNQRLAAELARRRAAAMLGALAGQQHALNQRIKQFESQQNAMIAKAHAQSAAPSASIMTAAKNNLNSHQLNAALQNQRQIAANLNRAAGQLQTANSPPSAAAQAQQQQARNLNQMTKSATGELTHLTAALQGAATPGTFTQAAQLAARLHQLAQQLLKQNPGRQSTAALQKALDQADAAANAANEHNTLQTRSALSQAGQLVRDSAKKNLAAKTVSPPSAQMNQAANSARQLAAAQTALAGQTAKQLQLLRQAAAQNPGNLAAQGEQMARQMNHADALAGKVEHQSANGAPDLARTVAQARAQIRAARQEQEHADQADQAGNAAMAQEHQQAAQLHMQLAQGDLNGLLNSPEMRDLPQYNDAIAGQISPRQPPQNSPAGSQNQAGKPNAPPPHANSLYDRLMAAAQQMNNAINSQSAAQAGNAQAAQSAANSLSAASQNLSAGMPGQNQEQGQQGQEQANGSGPNTGNPGNTLASGMPQPGMAQDGLAGRPGGASGFAASNGIPPKAVTELGISPAQWRNLGPLHQKELLDTARQKIPAGYRRLVRDYYLRLAKMHRTD